MAVLKFMLGNLRKRKAYSVVICILVFLAGLIMTATVSTVQNAYRTYDNAYENMKGPHLMYGIEEKYFKPEYVAWFENKLDVKSVKLYKVEHREGTFMEKNGNKTGGTPSIAVIEYDPADKMRLVDSVYPPEKLLTGNEVYLPYVYETNYGLKTGDEVDLAFKDKKMHYKIAGFIEEPLFGNDLSDMRFWFVSNAGMADYLDFGGEQTIIRDQIRIRLANYDESTIFKLRKDFAQICGPDIGFAFTYSELRSANLRLPDIALVVMSLFSLILCVITVTIIRYAVLATIEADFVNIGIIKSLGFTPLMVQGAVTVQYALLALLSGIISLAAGIFVTPALGRIVLKSSGLYFNGSLSAATGLIILFALVAIISVFSFITAGRTRKISPVRAIAHGLEPVHFSSAMNVKLERIGFMPFSLRMALKQIMTRMKRYALLLVITVLFIFTLVLLISFVKVFNSEKALNLLGSQFPDIRLTAGSRAEAERLVSDIRKDYDVQWTTYENTLRQNVEDEVITLRISDNFEASGEFSTLSGRFPKNDNEVAISALLKNRFNKDVGDYISIRDASGLKRQFIVTGTFQSTDNGGSSVRILESGMKVLNPEYETKIVLIKLKSHDGIDSVVNEMKGKYSGYDSIINQRASEEGSISTMQTVFSAISVLIFLFAVIIIGFITLLVVKITVYAETNEMGIFKALGFSSAQLRLQLALRFLIITVVGGLVGALLEALAGSQLFSLVLRSAGISSLNLGFDPLNALIPIGAISLIAMLSAWMSSGNTKKVSAYRLINE